MKLAGEVSAQVLPNTEPCRQELMQLQRANQTIDYTIPPADRVLPAPQECVDLGNALYSDGFATEDEDRVFFRMLSGISDSRFTYTTLYVRADHLSKAIITRAQGAENWTEENYRDWDHRCSVLEQATRDLYPNSTFGCYDGSADIITYPSVIPATRFDFTHSLSLITRYCHLHDYFVGNASIPRFTAIQWWR